MKRLVAIASFLLAATTLQAQTLEPIKTVDIGPQAQLRVDGKPFFPLMGWLQAPGDFALLKELNFNTMVGNDDAQADYAEKCWKAGLYVVPSFSDQLPKADVAKVAAMPNVLGWIHGDEPDMSTMVSDAEVVPGKAMKTNPSTPFFRILDGDLSSWTVIEPVNGGEFTIKLKQPVTVQGLGIALTVSSGLTVAKEVLFEADGKELLKTALENKAGRQKFDLPKPATFQNLTVRFTAEYPGKGGFGSVGEVEAYDKDGKDVLLSKPRKEPRTSPDNVTAAYKAIKAMDPAHPVFMNLTAAFMKSAHDYDDATRARIYPEYAKACDMLGFDTYPIYGSGFLSKILDPADGVTELKAFAQPNQPVYAWIETNRGSKWITASKQPEVKPEDTRFETWSAIIRGASGIGYFTHKWVDPDGKENYMEFAPKSDPAMKSELQRLNGQISRLAGAILAPAATVKIDLKLSDNLPSHFKATQADGSLWIFAQNIDVDPDAAKLRQFDPIHPRAGTATITVEGLKAGTKIEVVDENRTIDAADGQFTDDFPPLREHIYKIAWK